MKATDLELTNALFKLLVSVDSHAGINFSGIGLVVSERPQDLPIASLRPVSTPTTGTDVAEFLATISQPAHEHHDGFHVLSPNLDITFIAQYFSPPIVANASIDRSKRFGGRYLAAMFGSALPGVLATGIASRDFGIAVFRDGREVLHQRAALLATNIEKVGAP